MHRVVFVIDGHFLNLTHHDENGRGSPEQAILGPDVVLPGRRKVRNALLEEAAIDLDLGHDD